MEEKLQSNISNIVKKIFPQDIQSKRIIKEIQLLRELDQKFYKVTLQNSILGLKIMIDITEQCMLSYSSELKFKEKSILFEILLEPKFPFIYPKIFCRTTFTDPSIADGRDLLADILKTIWGPQVLLHQIVQKIPPFLVNQLEIYKMKEYNQLLSIGKFHLGYDYNLEDFLSLDSVNVFPAKQIIQNSSQLRYIIITSVNIMNFEVSDQRKGLIKLIQYSQLQNLQNIKRKKNNTKLVILLWKDPNESQQQIFELEDSQQLIDLIVKFMKQSGVKIIKNSIKKPDLTMDDVTGKKDFEGLNIILLMENISLLESEMEVELSVNSINTLMSLYQKAIEYFSALNDETYINYINRLQELLAKPQVQAVLDNRDQNKSEEKKEQENQEEEKQQQQLIEDSENIFSEDKEQNKVQQNESEQYQQSTEIKAATKEQLEQQKEEEIKENLQEKEESEQKILENQEQEEIKIQEELEEKKIVETEEKKIVETEEKNEE